MFTYRFEAIQEKTDRYWKFQNFQLVYEYQDTCAFPPPINLIFYPIYIYLCKINIIQEDLIQENSGNNFFLSKELNVKNSKTLEYAMEREREFAEELMIKSKEDKQKDQTGENLKK